MSTPLADVEDVEARWRTLTDAETVVAETLLGTASRMVRRRYSNVDERITAGTLDAEDVVDVVAGMVKRAMQNPVAEGVASQSQGAGPFSLSQTFANPNGNLYWTAEDIRVFEGAPGRAMMGWLA